MIIKTPKFAKKVVDFGRDFNEPFQVQAIQETSHRRP